MIGATASEIPGARARDFLWQGAGLALLRGRAALGRGLCTALLLGSALPAPATAETRYVYKASSCPVSICGPVGDIFIDGEIGPDEGARLDAEARARGIGPGSTVHLNSPGGSLYGGMDLGRAVRAHGFNTNVAAPPTPDQPYGAAGACLSACTLAFLGGQFRYVNAAAIFGVHRFYSPSPPPDAEATA